MGKKVREYKSGDFIFAKVKGYPAWPARVQRMNGKKYFVYFYGTGETANLPPNMIFDYAENKDKFLTKTVKRRDFNDGVKQIEHDFANNVPLEQVIGAIAEAPADAANDTANDTANETADDSAMDTTAADDTVDESTANTTQNDTAIEDSDDASPLVIDEGKKGKKGKPDAKTPAKETPAKEPPKGKDPKTPRGKAKKDEVKKDEAKKDEAKKDEANDDEAKKDEEIVSRSGRKIRPKRYIDEQTEENTTLPSPAPKKRRGASPAQDKDGDKEKEKAEPAKPAAKLYNSVTQSDLEDLKEPFKQEDADKDNLLIAYLPSGQYVGVKLFQSRPAAFKNESVRLTWDKQSAANSITIKQQLERGQITPQSVAAQLVMDLNLTDEEKAGLDKERETEEKKCRVQFLKTEMKLIELDAKIKTCLCLEKADTELCLKLLHNLSELDVKPLMLLKHPSCVETVKRMRAYVGNTPSWDLNEQEAAQFSKQAHRIRKQADALYTKIKNLFTTPEGLSFWEFFSERVLLFKKATAALTADELLELVHEPLELSTPTAHTMKAAVEAANDQEPDKDKANEEDTSQKKKPTPVKAKKPANNTPSKPAVKRQSSRKQQQEDKEKEAKKNETEDKADNTEENSEKPTENDTEKKQNEAETTKDTESTEKDADKDNGKDKDDASEKDSIQENCKEQEVENESKDTENSDKSDKQSENDDKKEKPSEKKEKASDKKEKSSEKVKEDKQEETKEGSEKDKEEIAEPRAKRSRESKKTEPPPPRSPAKRKSKN